MLPAALDRVLRDYERAWRAGDVQALVALFTADAFVLQPDRAPVRGHAALAVIYQGQGGGPLRLRAMAYATADSVGYIIGAYGYGDDPTDEGKFTLTLRRGRDGRWLIASDMDNGSRPARRPPVPPEGDGLSRSPTPVQQTLTRILAHAESASMYRDRVNWPATRAEVQRLADTATTIPGLALALRHLLRTMGDEHARVFHSGRPIAYYYGAPQPHLAGFDSDLNNRIQSATAFPFRSELIGRDVGYVRIVGLPMGDNTAMAKRIDDAVCGLHRAGASRWILDLRYNGGGNLNPMAEGVAGIIGDGPVGGWRGLTRPEDGEWSITNGDFVNQGYAVRLRSGCRIPNGQRVAVLTSLYTASSGEALAVMLKGRPSTRFFGGKTLGMITVTDWSVIDDSTAMSISVGHYRDRAGRVYDRFVDVDDETAFAPTESLASDAGVQRALAWLRGR